MIFMDQRDYETNIITLNSNILKFMLFFSCVIMLYQNCHPYVKLWRKRKHLKSLFYEFNNTVENFYKIKSLDTNLAKIKSLHTNIAKSK